jgi:peptide deformylase
MIPKEADYRVIRGNLMALKEIRTEGDESLRKKCRPVDKITPRILQHLDDLEDTLKNVGNGAALAAPQIGILRRLIVVDTPDGALRLINPEIIQAEGEREVEEGCLSVPGVWGKLMRPEHVRVRALKENGEEVTIEAQDDMAKCYCHEIDHLDGILFIDKVREFLGEDEDEDE